MNPFTITQHGCIVQQSMIANVTRRMKEGDANVDVIDKIGEQCSMTEAVLYDMMNYHVEAASELLIESGQMRFNVHKNFKVLRFSVRNLVMECNAYFRRITIGCGQWSVPGLEREFEEAGGSVKAILVSGFSKETQTDRIIAFAGAGNAYLRLHHPHYKALSHLAMVREWAMITLTVIGYWKKVVNANFFRTLSPPSEALVAKSVSLVDRTIAAIGFTKEQSEQLNTMLYPKREEAAMDAIRSRIVDFCTGTKIIALLEGAEVEFYKEYVEFHLAYIRQSIALTRSLPLEEVKMLYYKWRTKEDIRAFFTEIETHIPPCQTDEEEIDLAQRTANIHAPLIDEFRSMAVGNKRRFTAEEAERMEIDILIGEANENGGCLPLGTLRHLYQKHGTKKAVTDKVALMGDSSLSTLRYLRTLKVADLQ